MSIRIEWVAASALSVSAFCAADTIPPAYLGDDDEAPTELRVCLEGDDGYAIDGTIFEITELCQTIMARAWLAESRRQEASA